MESRWKSHGNQGWGPSGNLPISGSAGKVTFIGLIELFIPRKKVFFLETIYKTKFSADCNSLISRELNLNNLNAIVCNTNNAAISENQASVIIT